MLSIGIIANPAAGKDVRRIAAHGFTVDNEQKVNIVRRVVIGAAAAGCRDILLMPDIYGIGLRAIEGLQHSSDAGQYCRFIEMPVQDGAVDSVRAAGLMAAAGCGCLLTLGGDGTARLVAKGAPKTALLPLSTGTNNALPQFIEGTLAGMAAAFVAANKELRCCCLDSRPGLVVAVDGRNLDLALVDVAILRGAAIGARAVWDWKPVSDIVAARPRADVIGLSAVVGACFPEKPAAAWVHLGEGQPVLAAIAPGLVTAVPIASSRVVAVGETLSIGEGPLVVALDGEREHSVRSGTVTVTVLPDCARVVDVTVVLRQAALLGLLRVSG